MTAERITAETNDGYSIIDWIKDKPAKAIALGGIALMTEYIEVSCGDSTAHPVVPEYLSVEEVVDQPDLSAETTTLEVDGIEYTAAMPR